MKNIFLKGLISLLLTMQAIAPSKAQTNVSSPSTLACRQKLAQDIEAIINRPQFKRSRWGISLQNLATAETIYSRESDKFFIPASTVKLLTTAAALNELGADFRITTPIYATGNLPYLETVRIQGQGDPTITSDNLKNIVQQFQELGIQRINKLIIDDSYFATPSINPTWEWLDTYYYYATAVNSIILNENTARLTLSPSRVGQPVELQWDDAIAAQQWRVFNQGITATPDTPYSIEIDGELGQPVLNIRGKLPQDNQKDVWDMAIIEPANYFLDTLRSLLAAEGITVNQGIVTKNNHSNPQERIIAQIYAPPLSKILTEINQDSNNLYAEAILKILAKELNVEEIEALEISLNNLGITSDSYSLSDASGLSRQNLIAPETLVKILEIANQTNQQNIYQNSLAVASSRGTLKNRLTNLTSPYSFRGKTGSLSGVITLAGYLQLPNKETIGVAILVNSFEQKNRIARQAIDEIVLLLPEFNNCI